jgi:hypothetical protein
MFTESQVLLLTTSSLMTPTSNALGSQTVNRSESLDSRYIGRSVPFLIMLKILKWCLCKTSETCHHHNQNAPNARRGRLEEFGWKSHHKSTSNDGTSLESLPRAVYLRNSRYPLPLHHALGAKVPLSMVQLLLDANQVLLHNFSSRAKDCVVLWLTRRWPPETEVINFQRGL